jgi:hypothetical protein
MWTSTLPDTRYQGSASQGMGLQAQSAAYQPYGGSPALSASFQAKRDSSMFEAESEGYGAYGSQKRVKLDGNGTSHPSNQHGYDYRWVLLSLTYIP